MPKRAAPPLDGQLPSMVVHGRYLRQPDKGSYVRPAVPSGEAVSVSETGFDAGGLLDWSVTRVAAGRLSRQDVKDRALLMISGETIARLKADAASLPLRQPLEESSLRGGNFAENIFVSAAAGADSPCPDSLCVGDVLAVVAPRGSKRRRASSAAAEPPTLRVQVSSPRRPCSTRCSPRAAFPSRSTKRHSSSSHWRVSSRLRRSRISRPRSSARTRRPRRPWRCRCRS